MEFKDIIKQDITDVFLNMSEFADIHTLNGNDVMAIFDDDMINNDVTTEIYGSTQARATGLYHAAGAIYVSTADTGKPAPGSRLEFDGRQYTVISTSEQSGMYKINVQRVGGR